MRRHIEGEGMNEFSIIGSSPPRVDALEKVTGKAMFTADFMMPRMLSLKIVRSSQAHARIIGIDTSKAERLSDLKMRRIRKQVHPFGIVTSYPVTALSVLLGNRLC